MRTFQSRLWMPYHAPAEVMAGYFMQGIHWQCLVSASRDESTTVMLCRSTRQGRSRFSQQHGFRLTSDHHTYMMTILDLSDARLM